MKLVLLSNKLDVQYFIRYQAKESLLKNELNPHVVPGNVLMGIGIGKNMKFGIYHKLWKRI